MKAGGDGPKGAKSATFARPGARRGSAATANRPRGARQAQAAAAPLPAAATGESRRTVELVRFELFDVGRSMDFSKLDCGDDVCLDPSPLRRRDAPPTLVLPPSVRMDMDAGGAAEAGAITPAGVFLGAWSQAKLYDEGVIAIIVRLRLSATLEELHHAEDCLYPLGGVLRTISDFAEARFIQTQARIRSAVSLENYGLKRTERESYTAFCFGETGMTPHAFIASRARELATLLSGDTWGTPLHDDEVRRTLSNPFAYRSDEAAVFDLDRCAIVDPTADYEDLLVIVEHANYQLLELRVLDLMLDGWIDVAEKDMRSFYTDTRKKRRRLRNLPGRFAAIQALRLDALFTLENLENSSKIIGDFYYSRIYDHLAGIFSTEGWKWSVERRLEALQDVYDIVRGDLAEHRTLVLEIVFIAVCIIFPVIQILQVFLLP